MGTKILTVQVDNREKYPLVFPQTIRLEDPERPRQMNLWQVVTERITLHEGDYRLASHPSACIVERKASVLELNKNLMNPADLVRSSSAFARLTKACEHPVLLIEASPSEMFTNNQIVDQDILAHRLMRLVDYYKLQLLWVGRTTSVTNRRHISHLVLCMLYAYAMGSEVTASPDVDPGRGSLGIPGGPYLFNSIRN